MSHAPHPLGEVEHHTNLPAELDSSGGQGSAIVQVQPHCQQVPWCSLLLARCQLVCEVEEGEWQHQAGPRSPGICPDTHLHMEILMSTWMDSLKWTLLDRHPLTGLS